MQRHRPRPSRCAFTITELLVVIAVIALIIGLLFPAIKHVQGQARATECLSNLRSIGQAVTAYQAAYKDHYPLSSHTAGSLNDPGAWLKTLEKFGVKEGCRRCAADQHREQKFTSYATNDHFEPLAAGIDYDAITGQPLPGGRRRAHQCSSDIPCPAKTVYVAEPAGEGTVDHLHSVGWTTAEQVEQWIAVRRHDEGANYLFADCHVALVQWRRIEANFSAETSMFNPATAQ